MSFPHSKMPQMSATICIVSLVIVSVLVQNVSGKRGCAAFGHACYGGHGKRSSPGTLPEGYDGDGQQRQLIVESMPPPLPYAKALMALQMDRSRAYEAAPPAISGAFLRPGLTDLIAVGRDQPSGPFTGASRSEQDRFEQTVRFAVNAVLRQMLEENRLRQRDQQDVSELGQPQEQQQQQPQMVSEQN
ncbi:uncharacterized protein LOC119765509 [Culex quinquefasciatus]|uniref:uncharacterized protein LOC119765509 n=1 Tax=Culex quinquefasciatus TaxID=7176 RepID=UPI0018E3E1EC|nr:uncharacterized protein LOC119765509 [Culex quinquefasciatus]XP_038105423.1 uncharacterized protein LOC119765509 [Culex quinquefasciatus]XP_038105424.1 uncharacterized protein LOC119765509 [Culex quinquefasciatus]